MNYILNLLSNIKQSMKQYYYPDLVFLESLMKKVESGELKLSLDGTVFNWTSCITVQFKANDNRAPIHYKLIYSKGKATGRVEIWHGSCLKLLFQDYKIYNLFHTIKEYQDFYEEQTQKAIDEHNQYRDSLKKIEDLYSSTSKV